MAPVYLYDPEDDPPVYDGYEASAPAVRRVCGCWTINRKKPVKRCLECEGTGYVEW